jgi:hypothetical protein
VTKAYKVDREAPADREPSREGLAAAVRAAVIAANRGGLKYVLLDAKTAGHALAKLEEKR